ncbi:MAG: YGL010W-like membrane protein [Flammeovirgaceae bacterium]|jgi:uncharacterized membrane protein YGL010W
MQQWFDEYGESHQNKFNKVMHWICIPLIFFSVYGLLASIPAGFAQQFLSPEYAFYANFGTIVFILGLIFYLRVSFTMFLGMFIVCIFTAVGNYWLAGVGFPLWASSLVIFVVAWIGQFYGHKVEGKKPSFFKDLQFLMIGPAWLMGFIYKKIGIGY